MMKQSLSNRFLLFSLPLFILCSCSVSRTNVEDAANLKHHLGLFLEDASHARALIEALQNSQQTFEKEQKPKPLLKMFEEVYEQLPDGPFPMEHLSDHARVKSYILSSYTQYAKLFSLEKRAKKFLTSIRDDYSTPDLEREVFLPFIDTLLNSLDEPALVPL